MGSAASNTNALSNTFIDAANFTTATTSTPTYPGLDDTSRDAAIRSLANSIALCVNSDGGTTADTPCAQLFTAATPTGSTLVPTDTALAALTISLHPTSNVISIHNLAAPQAPFQPGLSSAPTDWTLGISPTPPQALSSTLNHSTLFIGDSITALLALSRQQPGHLRPARRRHPRTLSRRHLPSQIRPRHHPRRHQ